MSLSTCLLKAWALASANRRESGNGRAGLVANWSGVIQALHAINLLLCINGGRLVFTMCTSFTSRVEGGNDLMI